MLWVLLVASLSCAWSAVVPQLPQQFTAKLTQSVSLFPFPVSGVLSYDYPNSRQRFDATQFGFTTSEIDLFNSSRKYVFSNSQCKTCFLDPPMYPLYVPPIATYQGVDYVNGIKCDVWLADTSLFGLNMSFWVDSSQNPPVLAQAKFTMSGFNPTFPDVITTFTFNSIKVGPPAASLFVPPSNCGNPVCDAAVNVVFVLDGSGSITSTNFGLMKTFVLDVVAGFVLAPGKANIGVIQFASSVNIAIGLSNSSSAVTSAVQGMGQLGSGTNTAAGVSTATSLLLGIGNNVSSVMIILTDGGSNEGRDPVQAAAYAKSQGIEVYCVGVGSEINVPQLKGMASEPLGTHYYTASGFDTLREILDTLVSTSCTSNTCSLD